MVGVVEAGHLVIGTEQKLTELLGLPGKTGVDDRQAEPGAVGRRQVQLLARIETTDALGGSDALGQAGVIQVTGEAKARIESVGWRQPGRAGRHVRPTGMVGGDEEEMVRIASAEVVMADRFAAVPLLGSSAAQVADLGKSEEEIGLRRLDGLLVKTRDSLGGTAIVEMFEVEAAQRLPRPWREVAATDAGFPRFEQIRPTGPANADGCATGEDRADHGDSENKAGEVYVVHPCSPLSSPGGRYHATGGGQGEMNEPRWRARHQATSEAFPAG
jgi:hypothetical protein